MDKTETKKALKMIRYNLWYFPIKNADRINAAFINSLYHDEKITFYEWFYLTDYAVAHYEAKKRKINILLFNAFLEHKFLHDDIKPAF